MSQKERGAHAFLPCCRGIAQVSLGCPSCTGTRASHPVWPSWLRLNPTALTRGVSLIALQLVARGRGPHAKFRKGRRIGIRIFVRQQKTLWRLAPELAKVIRGSARCDMPPSKLTFPSSFAIVSKWCPSWRAHGCYRLNSNSAIQDRQPSCNCHFQLRVARYHATPCNSGQNHACMQPKKRTIATPVVHGGISQLKLPLRAIRLGYRSQSHAAIISPIAE